MHPDRSPGRIKRDFCIKKVITQKTQCNYLHKYKHPDNCKLWKLKKTIAVWSVKKKSLLTVKYVHLAEQKEPLKRDFGIYQWKKKTNVLVKSIMKVVTHGFKINKWSPAADHWIPGWSPATDHWSSGLVPGANIGIPAWKAVYKQY